METFVDARKAIYAEITSDNAEVRAEFLKRFAPDVERFSDAMARAFGNWRMLDAEIKGDEKRAYVSALVFTAITLHIQSMKLFLSGHEVAAGNLSRQVVESIALALVCSSKELNVLDRFMEDKYSTNIAVRDALCHCDKLGINKDAAKALSETQDFYHKYSHPTHLTLAVAMPFSKPGLLYVGASFDEGKLSAYEKEVGLRVSVAEVFPGFVDGVRANVAKW
jgi:hypothetical protein